MENKLGGTKVGLDEQVLAIIPARGGSKRLPGKNMLELGGEPLIGHTIKAARSCTCVTDIYVSTDCPVIQEYALSQKVQAPKLRPNELAGDHISMSEVLIGLLSGFEILPETIVILQPTSPLRSSMDIDNAYSLYKGKRAKNVVSVSEVSHPIQWSGKIGSDLSMNAFLDINVANYRSQDLDKYFQLNGAIYIANTKEFLSHKQLLFNDESSFAYIMPKTRSVDIDDYIDFQLAKVLYENLEKGIQ